MSAQAFGAQMPTHVTLDDVASMAAADENHRCELSPDGVLSIMPPADPEHALLVMRMILWLAAHGYGADGGATVHRHALNDAGEYEPDPAGPQPLTWLLTTTPDVG